MMSERRIPVPEHHPDPWVDQIHGYVTHVVETLGRAGVPVEGCWLDPSGPRDATILIRSASGRRALVWDEETGWREGRFVRGRQGERTVLDGESHLGGDVLPDGDAVLDRLLSGVREERRAFRVHSDRSDGFAARLAAHSPAAALV
ncbi:hypothetical protein DZF91_04330 [Actinomadura logoneensis]|uniref:DUF6292 domain-containing protein n=1 Tax=Actinomadura logoneensis TaxID=2293572 RepID=A0A372JS39_9ACTN|nr:DUF6292 family protein [Actinomadura logoneensis]RFU42855.1 hypothetical protein DZF91_04330 [Actinomadura logoneensis]